MNLVKYGFYHLGDFIIDNDKLRLQFDGPLRHVIYAFVCDEILYVGKTVDFRKRLNQYRNSCTSRSGKHVDTQKANKILEMIKSGKVVSVYIRQGFDIDGVFVHMNLKNRC